MSRGRREAAFTAPVELEIEVRTPAPERRAADRSRPVAVRSGTAARMAAAAWRAGGKYAIATGAGAAVCAAAGLPVELDLMVVGACGVLAWQRAAEGLSWHVGGGRAAARRRRKYQGEANPLEVRATLSPAAAQRKMARLAPGLLPSQAYLSVGLTAHVPHQAVALSRAESVGLFGVPQSFKTALLSGWILEAPGTVLATSSRADQYRQTVMVREQMGEVLVLDADGFGPGTNFGWDPVEGYASSATALRRAGDLMHASPRDHSGKDAFHEDRGVRLLRCALHAAALSGGNMLDVRAWVQDPESAVLRKVLQQPNAAPGWAQNLEAMIGQGPDFLASASASAEAALGWLDDEALCAAACPEEGDGLDVADFLSRPGGTVYLIGAARPYGSLTPFFSAFVTEFLEQAKVTAERCGGRLPVPLTIAADEAATTARIDFGRWCAVTAGYNITVIAGFQAFSQVAEGWGGETAARTVLNLFNAKIVGGGHTDPVTLEELSHLCGTRETWRDAPGGRVHDIERVFPPERLRLLPDFHVLVVHRNCKPVQVKIRPVWNHPDYRPVEIVTPVAGEVIGSVEEAGYARR